MMYKKLQLWKDKANNTDKTVQQECNDVAEQGTAGNPPKFGCPNGSTYTEQDYRKEFTKAFTGNVTVTYKLYREERLTQQGNFARRTTLCQHSKKLLISLRKATPRIIHGYKN